MGPAIGIIALQGSFAAHARALQAAGARPLLVRERRQLGEVSGLVLPGGESTTLRRLLDDGDLGRAVRDLVLSGWPLLGTCAGAILMARGIENPEATGMGLIDVDIRRNAYGRQLESFCGEVSPVDAALPNVPGIFIRAPMLLRCGPGVRVLARLGERPVLVRQGARLACTFHPELTREPWVHAMLIDLALSPPRRCAAP